KVAGGSCGHHSSSCDKLSVQYNKLLKKLNLSFLCQSQPGNPSVHIHLNSPTAFKEITLINLLIIFPN
ncbi:hypothetical protein, partial [Lelliottia sp. WAP21]|uniref:hypothetical protein n=1 Tax=Lelliottia sp. WAP21 TaxID=2877426 RepID=UPI001F182899